MKLLRKSISLAAVLGTASLVLAASTPFAGTWKVNLEKSILVGDTVKFSPAGDVLATTGDPRGVVLWEAAEGKLKGWLDSYNKAFPVAAQSESVFGYDSVYAVVDCVKRTNSTDRAKIRDVLASFKFTSPLGTNVDFQNPPDGDNRKPTVLIVRATGPGKYEVVK